jgi:hypothetical protein
LSRSLLASFPFSLRRNFRTAQRLHIADDVRFRAFLPIARSEIRHPQDMQDESRCHALAHSQEQNLESEWRGSGQNGFPHVAQHLGYEDLNTLVRTLARN